MVEKRKERTRTMRETMKDERKEKQVNKYN